VRPERELREKRAKVAACIFPTVLSARQRRDLANGEVT
jgi:hypothetical protein